jgi:outer membrane scaffolding protein for murein synthesis (MipA/OmpV family)
MKTPDKRLRKLHPVMFGLAGVCFVATSALGQDEPAQEISKSPGLPLWEVGLFGAGYTQPAYPGAADRTGQALVLPYVIYRGKYLRADRGVVGFRALKTPRTELDIGFAASLGSRSADIPARKGIADLGTMIEFGPRLKIKLGDMSDRGSETRLQFPLRKVIDVSYGFRSRGIAFEPQWVNDKRLSNRWAISTTLGALFGDYSLADTFYGIDPGEATPSRPSYTAKAGLIALRAGLFASQSLTTDVRAFYFMRIDSLAGAANRDSPLVRRDNGWSAGIVLAWGLARSEKNAID